MKESTKVLHPYITKEAGVCGGSYIIKGTRIRVIDIVIEYEYLGLSPDEILESHPHLKLQEVHDALSFYYENREETDKEIRNRLEDVEKFQREYSSKLQRWIK